VTPGESAAPAAASSWTLAARRWLPWLVAAAILAALAVRLPRAQLLAALAIGPSWTVALCSAAVAAAVLVADAGATLSAFAATGVRCPWRSVLVARGATYLLGLLNFAAGQGGMGVYLHRAGVEPLRAVGTLLFLLATQVGALAAVAAAGGVVDPAAGGGWLSRSLPVLAVLAAGFALYLALLAWRPAWLARREVLAPLLAAGGKGLLQATAARLPHVLAMIVGLWLGLRLWGIPLPLAHGLVVLSAAVLITVLPLAPSGLGTLELALVAMVSPFAPGASAAAQRADVLAFALVYHLFGIVTQALLGLLCLARITRQARAARLRGERAVAECVVAPLPAGPPG
jgi:uncharacterized membrane protein YbhN (UPF0104 family)